MVFRLMETQLLGTITDVTGNAALLTHAALGVQAPHTVDATPSHSQRCCHEQHPLQWDLYHGRHD